MLDRSIAEIAKLLRTRAITVEGLIEAAIGNRDESLHAYREWDPERARLDARAADATLRAGRDFGPLHGLPISIKDLYGVPGTATYAGTTVRFPANWEIAGPVVRTFLDRMSVVMGKTHTVELAFSGIGINNHWGTPKNPWDKTAHRIPGGSSSGAGVSLVEGTALVALGTDTAGSVRVPASMTGQVGVKTTKGRWSTDGIVPLSSTLDTPGFLARTVEDAVVVFEAIDRRVVPAPPDLSRVRLGVLGEPFFDECDPGIAEAVTSAASALAKCGASVRAVDLPEAGRARETFRAGGVSSAELFAFLSAELPAVIEQLDPVVRDRITGVAEEPAHAYVARRTEMTKLARAADERFSEFDAWIAPTVAGSPPTVESLNDLDNYRRANMLALRNTAMVSCLGLCAISMPVGLDVAGMPIGLQLIGRAGEDDRLLSVARSVERALGSGAIRLRLPDTKNGGR